jgi:hypothetical protein
MTREDFDRISGLNNRVSELLNQLNRLEEVVLYQEALLFFGGKDMSSVDSVKDKIRAERERLTDVRAQLDTMLIGLYAGRN